MRNTRLLLTVLFAAFAISSTACTTPLGPKPSSDDVHSTGY